MIYPLPLGSFTINHTSLLSLLRTANLLLPLGSFKRSSPGVSSKHPSGVVLLLPLGSFIIAFKPLTPNGPAVAYLLLPLGSFTPSPSPSNLNKPLNHLYDLLLPLGSFSESIDLRRAHDYAVLLLLPLGSFLNPIPALA